MRLRSSLYTLLVLLVVSVSAFAQQEKPDFLTGGTTAISAVAESEIKEAGTVKGREFPIDREVSAFLEKDPSTFGQQNAFKKGIELWDAELNTQFRALSAKLDDPGKKALREAQRAWLAFRDAEFKRIDDLYARKDGTMYRPMAIAARMELVKARALEFADSIEFIDR